MTRFSPADPEESPAVDLLREMTAELNAMYRTDSRLDLPKLEPHELRAPGGLYLVGWDGETAVAGGGLRRYGEGVAEIKRMYVRPAARSRGIARALLAALESAAHSLGYQRARLDTGPKQVNARALYVSAGFLPLEPYNDNPFASFWGEKILEDQAL